MVAVRSAIQLSTTQHLCKRIHLSLRIDFSVVLRQVLGYGHAVGLRGQVQRAKPVTSTGISVRTALQQKRRHVGVILLTGQVKGCEPVLQKSHHHRFHQASHSTSAARKSTSIGGEISQLPFHASDHVNESGPCVPLQHWVGCSIYTVLCFSQPSNRTLFLQRIG